MVEGTTILNVTSVSVDFNTPIKIIINKRKEQKNASTLSNKKDVVMLCMHVYMYVCVCETPPKQIDEENGSNEKLK